jgi:hypothetical protein
MFELGLKLEVKDILICGSAEERMDGGSRGGMLFVFRRKSLESQWTRRCCFKGEEKAQLPHERRVDVSGLDGIPYKAIGEEVL